MSYAIPDAVAALMGSLVNVPWVRDQRNCWRLSREIVGALGYDLPEVLTVAPAGREGRALKAELFNSHPERARWREVTRPDGWALALMRRPFRGVHDIEHSGVYFACDGGVVFHTCNPHGAVIDTLPELALRNWVPIYLVPL